MAHSTQQGTKIQVGVPVKRHFTNSDESPFDQVTWTTMDAVIAGPDGREKFRQNDVEAPSFWSQRAVNIVAEKYFRVIDGKRETSIQRMIDRVARTISESGVTQGVIAENNRVVFYNELCFLLLHQMFAFNSPVWFNIGVPGVKQQASACFIQDVTDDMGSITDLQTKEVMLFKGGSGTGSNLSKLRSSREKLSNGGVASGPVSFALGLDAWAGVTKSGGGTRRAAKMVILNDSHPDIMTQANGRPGFIGCKAMAEQIAHDLFDTGKYTAEFNKPGNVYEYVPYQNANHSLRVSDEFMAAVEKDLDWDTKYVTTGEKCETYKARAIWNEIVKAAHFCGDPGLQFDTTINKWNTCPNSGRINASNPCSEYMHLDDTACNLGSFNLMKFVKGEEFDIEGFRAAVRICITAMEILVSYSEYPSEKIGENARKYRQLGIGYANLGSLLMNYGLAYDSDEGRAVASAITSIMSGEGYAQSARIAQESVGPFPEYHKNRDAMLEVVGMHRTAAQSIRLPPGFLKMGHAAISCWDDACTIGQAHGFRNSQISVLAPTGTIGFMMDCDTTGIECMLAILQYKKLVGGGMLKMLNQAALQALKKLGYSEGEVELIVKMLNEDKPISSIVKPEHQKVFQTALGTGSEGVSVDGHLKMMAAVQPFLSGAISKTVNLPNSATLQDVDQAYMMAWKMGLKAVALYRDDCKLSQPASAKLTNTDSKDENRSGLMWGERKRLEDERPSITHKFSIGGHEGYLTVGMYDDGSPGELFVVMSKEGSTIAGLMDAFATQVSLGLQHGVPLGTIIDKLMGTNYEPAGFTQNENFRMVSSITDYIGRWLKAKFSTENVEPKKQVEPTKVATKMNIVAGPPCVRCGNMTQRSGSCWACATCGTTTGCG